MKLCECPNPIEYCNDVHGVLAYLLQCKWRRETLSECTTRAAANVIAVNAQNILNTHPYAYLPGGIACYVCNLEGVC